MTTLSTLLSATAQGISDYIILGYHSGMRSETRSDEDSYLDGLSWQGWARMDRERAGVVFASGCVICVECCDPSVSVLVLSPTGQRGITNVRSNGLSGLESAL